MSPERDEARSIVLEVGADEAGGRVDAWIAERTELSRTRVQKLLDAGRVRLLEEAGGPAEGGGRTPSKSEPVEVGWRLEVRVPAPRPIDAAAEDIPLQIVYQDEQLLVVDKPAGMVVHPAPGHPGGTLVNALLHHVDDLSGIGGRLRPGIVHRLDKDTSGLLVVAKSDTAHRALSDALRRRRMKRLYRAAVWGHLKEERNTIDAPIGRDPRERRKMAVVEGGRRAVSRTRLRERWAAAELLDVALQTGRTHQIRVHLAHVGHPVVGDGTYGPGRERGMSGVHRGWARELARRTPRQFLHAAELVFEHPSSGERMRFSAPLPPELAEVVAWARSTSGYES